MKKFVSEFKAFALKGSMIDLAIGLVLGSAVTAVITSITADIITPLIGALLGNLNDSSFKDAAFILNGSPITYGNFLVSALNFLLVAFVLFLIVKAVNHARSFNKVDEAPVTPVDTQEVALLKEILETLKAQDKK